MHTDTRENRAFTLHEELLVSWRSYRVAALIAGLGNRPFSER